MAEQTRRRKAADTVAPEPSVEAAPEPTPAPKAAPKPKTKANVNVETDLIFRRRLEQGDHGPAVREVQRLLAAKGGWDGPEDGRYGTLLARAVRVFQGAEGLKINGEVDILTWRALNA